MDPHHQTYEGQQSTPLMQSLEGRLMRLRTHGINGYHSVGWRSRIAAKVCVRRPTTAIIMSHLCLRAWNGMAGPATMLSQLKDENLKVAGIAPGVPVEIHGNWSLNAKGVRVIAHLLANVGSPSSIMQAQPHEDMLASTTIVPLSTAIHIRIPQLLRQVSEWQTQNQLPSGKERLRKVRAEDPPPRLGKEEVRVGRTKFTRGTVTLTTTIPRPP